MAGFMRAAVYRGGRNLECEEVLIPELRPGELLVRVHACGVCGTDLKKIQYALVDPPRIFGHEMAGVVAATGSGVSGWETGDRIALNHHVPCERPECFFCSRGAYAQCPVYKKTGTTAGFEPAGGGFAEYVRVMDWCAQRGSVRVPDGTSLEEATFIEPLNTCLKGVRMAGLQQGDTVVVIGQGPIGLLFTMLARCLGAHVVASDLMQHRRNEALCRGAVAAVDPSLPGAQKILRDTIDDISAGRGADIAIVAVANTSVIPQALAYVRPAGKVLLFAQTRLDDPVEVDAGMIGMQEKALIGSYSSDITLQQTAADLIFTRKVDVRGLVTHCFTLDRIAEAIDLAGTPVGKSLKIMVTP